MKEEEFDAFMRGRSYNQADLKLHETQAGRCTSLGVALWGTTMDDLEHQLLAPYPEIPSGFDLVDFRKLQDWCHLTSARIGDERCAWLPRALCSSTAWEARGEVVRRAIEYLEKG